MAAIARILVIDDDPDPLAALIDTLTDEGFEVEAVSSGRAGVEAARRKSFDVALTDLVMPDMDGAALLARVKELGTQKRGLVDDDEFRSLVDG